MESETGDLGLQSPLKGLQPNAMHSNVLILR